MSYHTTPPICIGCARKEGRVEQLTTMNGTKPIWVTVCRNTLCRGIAQRIAACPSDFSLINEDRKAMTEQAGTKYYPFVSGEEWLKLKVK